MPFYLAIPRNATFSGAVQKGSMVKSDFVRTQPSQLLYNIVSEISGPLYPVMADHLGSVVRAHSRSLAEKATIPTSLDDVFFYAPCTIAELPSFVIPKVQVRFKGPPPPTAQEMIDRLGADVKKLKGAAVDTYTFRPNDMEALAELMNLEGIDADFRPTEGAISVPQIEQLAYLYTRISCVAAGLKLLSPFGKTIMDCVTETDVPALPPTETMEVESTSVETGKVSRVASCKSRD
jgi:hypothetical protein